MPKPKNPGKKASSENTPSSPLHAKNTSENKTLVSPKDIKCKDRMFSPSKYTSIRMMLQNDTEFMTAFAAAIKRLENTKKAAKKLSLYLINPESCHKLNSDIDESILSLTMMLDREYNSFKQTRNDNELRTDLMATLMLATHIPSLRLSHLLQQFKNEGGETEQPILYLTIKNFCEKHDKQHKETLDTLFSHGIQFSQIEASDKFKPTLTTQSSSSTILGQSVIQVGENIKKHPELLEHIKIGVFIYQNQMVAENNRGLSAFVVSEAPLRHAKLRLIGVAPTQLILNAYIEKLSKRENPYKINLIGEDHKKLTVQAPQQWQERNPPSLRP